MKMKYISCVLTLALLSISSVVFAAEGIERLDEAWRKAITSNDLNAVVACYAKDAVLWTPDAVPAKGEEAIRKSYSDLLAANTVTNASLTNTHYQMCGDLSIGWGEFTLSLSPKSGANPTILSGRFTVVAKKEGGKWVYIVDHASANPAATPSPAP
ncbi:MAG: hypothetical protein DMF03_04785 [Verrucomicrobia bacterium]|nr:MAG: hypothetical protein DMF03_04785 [Verrucomicrobiota bacterium]